MIKVREWMSKDVQVVQDNETIQRAAQIMAEHNFGSLIVVDANQKPVGIITERDLAQKVCAQNVCAADTPIKDIMTATLISANEEDSVSEVSKRMHLSKIKKMPVIKDGRVTGMFTTTDLQKVMRRLQEDLFELSK